jgi:hypothetical protein
MRRVNLHKHWDYLMNPGIPFLKQLLLTLSNDAVHGASSEHIRCLWIDLVLAVRPGNKRTILLTSQLYGNHMSPCPIFYEARDCSDFPILQASNRKCCVLT